MIAPLSQFRRTFARARVTLFALTCAAMCAALFPLFETSTAETLEDVIKSRAMQRIQIATDVARTRRNSRGGDGMSWFNGMDPQSNFALLWADKNGAQLTLSWLGANIVNYKLVNTFAKRYSEMIRVETAVVDRNKIPIRLRIMIPHPTYRMMVQMNTIAEFNEVEPPTLRIVASDEIEISGQKAMYYRSEKGSCSLVVKLAQLSVLVLETRRCEHSSSMMEIARQFDFTRFNEKLNS